MDCEGLPRNDPNMTKALRYGYAAKGFFLVGESLGLFVHLFHIRIKMVSLCVNKQRF